MAGRPERRQHQTSPDQMVQFYPYFHSGPWLRTQHFVYMDRVKDQMNNAAAIPSASNLPSFVSIR